MDRSQDLALRRMLKNWASAVQAPENGRAHLIWAAASRKQSRAIEISWFSALPQKNIKLYDYIFLSWPLIDGFYVRSTLST